MDALARERRDSTEAARSLGLDASRPTVIFAPTFSTASALHESGEAIIETLLQAGCNVIAKLHDRSLDPDPRFSGGVDWSARLHRFAANPSFLLAAAAIRRHTWLASDVMVTDHSSIGFEFCVLDRPLIVFEAARLASAARINPEKIALLRSAALVAHDRESLREAVLTSLADPSAQSAARRRVAAQVFYRPGSATERALRLVYELLELEPAPLAAGMPAVRAWSPEVKYSIVIATFNRADDLRDTLQSLAGLNPDGPWEVIVVDNNSPDDTRAGRGIDRPRFPGGAAISLRA